MANEQETEYPLESKTGYIPKEETEDNEVEIFRFKQYEIGKPIREIIKAKIMKHES